jgi:UDP-N-acetylmuramoyl-L-alanyl-D-glutamate--2,6-diaminopimelate ligase
MQLTQLLKSINLRSVSPTASPNDCVLTGVTNNSQQVRPGYIFVAIRGLTRDAHDFVPQAIDLGAAAIVCEGFTTSGNLPIPYITVQNARAALAEIAGLLNGNPSEHLKIIGVTGTKGKTTVTWLTHHLLRHSGYKVGLLSTVGYKTADDELHNFAEHFTTPEAPEIQSTL